MNQPLSAAFTHSLAQPSYRIALVSASWHPDIVSHATEAAISELAQLAPGSEVAQFEVPGAFEIPLHTKRLADSGRFDAIIAFGLVVNGGIYRHEFVTTAVIEGLMRVQLDSDVPVFSAVLTPRDFHEHDEHQAFFRSHFVKKGREVAQACLATLHSLARLPVAIAA
ncbi:6,7-dimethyl-8-ribityllumazine synthase [Chitinolyticbacter albus]|uniref:6,7-dimethyl-8-ribityllumazine synthase n=1 Tax=Chitinolyticbacter albus TaxID=2961951 RepID=UPI00210A3FF1|nr:6,7-dimethyl-8-ribityllumazine synthase [Chitinolyticbacter albus]